MGWCFDDVRAMNWNRPADSGGTNRDSWGDRGSAGSNMEDAFAQALQFGRNFFGGGPTFNPRSIFAALVAVAAIWGALGFYQLNEQERAVVLRLGRFHSLVQPGLRWRIPVVDKIYKVNVTKVYSESYDGHMLTKDENIVDVRITFQYRVADPKHYVLRVRNPIGSMRLAAESALRHVVGGSVIDHVITFGREQVALAVKQRMQGYLELYQSGIAILQVNINEASPPQAVKEAFDDVNKALEDEARYINEAEAYANEVVPRARGIARRAIEESEAYRVEVIARAEGDVARFSQLLTEYRQAPGVTRQRMYLDAVEEVMGKVSKVVVDVQNGGSLFYLPLDRLMRASRQALPVTAGDAERLRQEGEQQRQPAEDSRRRPGRSR